MRVQSTKTFEFIVSKGGTVTADDVAAQFGLSAKAALWRLKYLCNIGVLARHKIDDTVVFTVQDADAASYTRPYVVNKEKTATGTIVRFGDKWRPQAAIRPKSLVGGISSIMLDE